NLAAQAMDEGALGISTGYFPAHVTTDEIVAVTEVVAAKGGLYASHIRNEADGLLGAMEEIIEIGVRAQVPVQVSHVKTYGRRNWHKIDAVLNLMERAHERGVDLLADRYPYVACFSGAAALLPLWLRSEAAQRGGLKTLRDPAWADRVRRGIIDQFHLLGGPDQVVLAPLDPQPEMDGKRLDEYARQRNEDPVDTAINLVLRGGVSCIYFVMCEENLRACYRHSLVTGGSDGHLRILGEGMSHPRNYGTFPRFIGHYGRDLGLFTVEEAVRKCTSMNASRFGLKDRGVLAKGKVADVVLFDWEKIADCATFENPHQYPVGIPWVIVNGRVAVAAGEVTPQCHGRVVRRGE
ncbi:MAG: amidohydrolase family protein, partial [Armatimonadota bacterium]|nr:amidohydrolase family protein [Armatimonadota bacterium]